MDEEIRTDDFEGRGRGFKSSLNLPFFPFSHEILNLLPVDGRICKDC